MGFDYYSAVDENHQFPLVIRQALAASDELKNMVVPMSQVDRNNLSGPQVWDNRLIFNTTSSRINRYNGAISAWEPLSDQEPGIFVAYGGPNPPSNMLKCDASVVSRGGINAGLFAAIGTTYNTGGEANDKFRLPNGLGRVLVGFDANQTEFNTLGKIGGEKSHTLTIDELAAHTHGNAAHVHPDPGHSHTDSGHTHDSNWKPSSSEAGGYAIFDGPAFDKHNKGFVDRVAVTGGGRVGTGSGNANITGSSANLQGATVPIENTGGGKAHNILPPYLTVNYCITL